MSYTYSTAGPICPYCEYQHRADEPFYYDEDTTVMTCDHCDRDFDVQVYTSTSWTCERQNEDSPLHPGRGGLA